MCVILYCSLRDAFQFGLWRVMTGMELNPAYCVVHVYCGHHFRVLLSFVCRAVERNAFSRTCFDWRSKKSF